VPRAAVLAALFLAALALRPQIIGAGPLFPLIEDDLETSHAVVGLLSTIPVVCMGVFAPPAAWLTRRLGTRAAIGLSLALIGAFGIGRAFAPEAWLLVLLTFPVGIGIGFAGALMPVAVKERFPDRPGFATGVYATGISVGSTATAAAAVPLAHAAAGGWRASLVAFSVVTVGLVAAWSLLTRGSDPHVRPAERPPPPPLRSRTGWLLVAIFAFMSAGYYGVNAWLPDAYVERGWSDAEAGALLAAANGVSLVSGLVVPWLSDRHGRGRYLVISGLLGLLGIAGFVLAPAGAYAWAAIVGFGWGAVFPLVMTLPLDLEERPERVGALVGLMLGGGYVLGAVIPFGLGAVRDATGSYAGVLWILVATSVLFTACAVAFARGRVRAHAAAPMIG
jgi:CP family cyanate transporter-like MFS transporter